MIRGMLIVKRIQVVAVVLVCVAFLFVAAGCGASPPVVKSVTPKKGFPGTGFKITGTVFGNLQTKGAVHLGSKTAPASLWAETSISANVPNGMAAGDYSLTVVTPAGTSNKVAFKVDSSYAASSPLPAMTNYFKSNNVDTAGMTFAVVSTSKSDPNWKIDKATSPSQGTSYFLFHKDGSGWNIVDYGTTLSTAQLKADGAPSDLSTTSTTG